MFFKVPADSVTSPVPFAFSYKGRKANALARRAALLSAGRSGWWIGPSRGTVGGFLVCQKLEAHSRVSVRCSQCRSSVRPVPRPVDNLPSIIHIY